MEATPETPRGGGKKQLTRQRSRLQMHAPSSIQVVPATTRSVAEWNVAIPLLSPLDIAPIPRLGDRTAEPAGEPKGTVDDGEEDGAHRRWAAWQHPAAPFYYEPVPGNQPAFVLPHCA